MNHSNPILLVIEIEQEKWSLWVADGISQCVSGAHHIYIKCRDIEERRYCTTVGDRRIGIEHAFYSIIGDL